MDSWIVFFLTISIAVSLKLLISKVTSSSSSSKTPSLPPGPPAIPLVIQNALRWTSLFELELELVLRRLHAEYGPIICLRVPFHPTVFIADRNLIHEALVQKGLVFADRPSIVGGARKLVTGYSDINNSSYGPLWRVLRRNLTSEIVLPQRTKLFGPGRQWALGLLLDRLRLQSVTGDRVVNVMDSFQLTMLSLLVLICFGEKVNEEEIQEIQSLQFYFLSLFVKFNPFGFLPSITKHVFRKKWDEIVEAVRRQEGIFLPLIKLRRQKIREGELAYSYVDSLIDVELEGGRKLRDEEISNLCHEFMSAGTDTTSNAMEWIVAELVRNQEVQGKLRAEIDEMVKDGDAIEEEDLKRMPYLKAVIAEGLRRHPPAHFLLPHKATEDATVGGYLVPKGAEVHVNVVEAGWDGKVWEEPMEFRPERFLGREVDLTGSREIKMMPFGIGRRMCPGYRLALLHLEYFVANLVREFEWDAVEGEEVDMSEILQLITIMKNPLRARIRSRRKEIIICNKVSM